MITKAGLYIFILQQNVLQWIVFVVKVLYLSNMLAKFEKLILEGVWRQ